MTKAYEVYDKGKKQSGFSEWNRAFDWYLGMMRFLFSHCHARGAAAAYGPMQARSRELGCKPASEWVSVPTHDLYFVGIL